jgi:hypothetical protein
MSIELLNAELITVEIKKRGLTRKHVIAQLGLGQDGYKFLRGEWLPKNLVRKTKLVKELAKLLGVEVPQILLTLKPSPMKRPA